MEQFYSFIPGQMFRISVPKSIKKIDNISRTSAQHKYIKADESSDVPHRIFKYQRLNLFVGHGDVFPPQSSCAITHFLSFCSKFGEKKKKKP